VGFQKTASSMQDYSRKLDSMLGQRRDWLGPVGLEAPGDTLEGHSAVAGSVAADGQRC